MNALLSPEQRLRVEQIESYYDFPASRDAPRPGWPPTIPLIRRLANAFALAFTRRDHPHGVGEYSRRRENIPAALWPCLHKFRQAFRFSHCSTGTIIAFPTVDRRRGAPSELRVDDYSQPHNEPLGSATPTAACHGQPQAPTARQRGCPFFALGRGTVNPRILRRVPWTCEWGRVGVAVEQLSSIDSRVDDVFWACHNPVRSPEIQSVSKRECETCPEWAPARRLTE